jgi:hypothetical protein
MSILSQLAAHTAADTIRRNRYVVSDEDVKLFTENTDPKELAIEILEQGPPFDLREVKLIVAGLGNMDTDHDFEQDGHRWRDDILDAYAEHIMNYRYTYKPEAQEIDPEIDPEEEHIGPMAQDIEQVNPAAVKETPDGIKTVDTGRLALMNAGAIAELARQMKELQNG